MGTDWPVRFDFGYHCQDLVMKNRNCGRQDGGEVKMFFRVSIRLSRYLWCDLKAFPQTHSLHHYSPAGEPAVQH